MQPAVKKYGLAFIKLALIAGIFFFLFYRAAQNNAFHELLVREKNWRFLIPGLAFNLLATVLTIIRWRWLVRALDVPLSYKDSFRIGFIGFIFNLSPVGIVGGDVIKSCLLARKAPDKTAEVAASVIVDRVIGLYVMFLIGCGMIVSTGFFHRSEYVAKFAVTAMLLLTVVSTLFIVGILFPDSKRGTRRKILINIPLVGKILEKITVAIQVYRNDWRTLIGSVFLTLGVHCCFAISLYCFAMGMFQYAPSLIDHLVIYPVANTGSMIPLSAGPFEYFLDVLYPLFDIPHHHHWREGFGMLVGIVWRLAVILVAGIGGIYYLGSRNEIAAAMKIM